jgi:Co/Zn/Cd efflux system component
VRRLEIFAVTNNGSESRILVSALVLNGMMFLIGLAAGLYGQSSGLIADSFDMLADATAYGIALLAISRGTLFKAWAARLSGILLLLLGISVLIDAARRALVGSAPDSTLILATAFLSLIVNLYAFRLLGKVRGDGIHLHAAWIFTRADVTVNIGVMISGALVALTGFRLIDAITGAVIALYILKESFDIITESQFALSSAHRYGPREDT